MLKHKLPIPGWAYRLLAKISPDELIRSARWLFFYSRPHEDKATKDKMPDDLEKIILGDEDFRKRAILEVLETLSYIQRPQSTSNPRPVGGSVDPEFVRKLLQASRGDKILQEIKPEQLNLLKQASSPGAPPS